MQPAQIVPQSQQLPSPQPGRNFTPYNAPIKDAKLLPAQPPAQVFGRNRELASGHVALKAGTAIFLYGPVGVGKTALAAVLAAAYTVQNAGGVLWFHMNEDDADLLLARVGRAYGVNSLTANEDAGERLKIVRALLERNRPLIVLDGLTDSEAVRDFARSAAAGIPLIVTNDTQAAGPWMPIPIPALSADAAGQMLRTLSGRHEAGYAEDLDGICRILNGDPLAIELAGRLMAADDVKPAELLTALLGTIPSGVTRADAQETMLAVAYKGLTPTAQAVLLILGSAFGGDATAELLADMSGMPAAQLAPVMRQIYMHGFVHESSVYGQARYTLHERVQIYVRGLMDANQRLAAVENRSLDAILAYVKRHARPEISDHDRLAAEMDNIIGGAAFATSTGQEPPVRQLVTLLSADAGDFVTLRGFQTEMLQLRKLLALVGRISTSIDTPPSSVIARTPATPIAQVESTAPESVVEPVAEVPSEPPVSMISFRTADSPPSTPFLTPAPPPLAMEPELPVRSDLFSGPSSAPHSFPDLPDELATVGAETSGIAPFDESVMIEPLEPSPEAMSAPPLTPVAALQHAIDDARANKDNKTLSASLEQLGDLYLADNDAPRAVSAYTEATEALRATEDWLAIGLVMRKLGNAYIRQGQTNEGILMFEQALTIFRKQRQPDQEMLTLGMVGDSYATLHNWPKAQESHEAALYLARETHAYAEESVYLGDIAFACEAQGNVADAVDFYREGLHVAYGLNDGELAGHYAYQLGRLLLDDTTTLNQAVQLLGEAATRLPADDAVQRLLKRGRRRLEHLHAGGVDVPLALANTDYAAAVVSSSASASH